MGIIDETKIIDIKADEKNTDPHVPVIDLRSGLITEHTLGPNSAAFQSGDRPAMWEPRTQKAVIGARYARTHMFYRDFCIHPEALRLASEKTGETVTEKEGASYFEKYVQFMALRGHGSKANTSIAPPEYHPAITRKIRSAARAPEKQSESGELLTVLRDLLGELKSG